MINIWLGLLILFVIFLIVLIIIYIMERKTDGELQIDTSNPNKDIYRLELTVDPDIWRNKKMIKLKVVKKALSHEKHSL